MSGVNTDSSDCIAAVAICVQQSLARRHGRGEVALPSAVPLDEPLRITQSHLARDELG